jgi:hypothetical protein
MQTAPSIIGENNIRQMAKCGFDKRQRERERERERESERERVREMQTGD